MKTALKTLSILSIAALLLSFTYNSGIGNCFITFKKAAGLTAAAPERLPEGTEKTRRINTSKGEAEVSRIDGYRILYNNEKEATFVNLKVELSDQAAYKADQNAVVANLIYLASQSTGMEKKLTELEYNGYKIYGISRETIETTSSTLGIFVMFPGNDITVYFYFNNLRPGVRNFESTEDYKKQRDAFIEAYAKHLHGCKGK